MNAYFAILFILASFGGSSLLGLNGSTYTVGLCSSSVRCKPNAGSIDSSLAMQNENEKVSVKNDRIDVSSPNAASEQHSESELERNRSRDLQTQIDELRKAVETQRTEIENLRSLLICRTSMRPELCGDEQ